MASLAIGLCQLEVGIEVGHAGDVRVHVDETWHRGHGAEVDDCVAGLGSDGVCGCDRGDGVAGDKDGLRVEKLACLYIEHVAGAHQGSLRLRADHGSDHCKADGCCQTLSPHGGSSPSG